MQINCSHTEVVELDSLIENPKNPNTHPDKQINLLAKIMKYQGWRNPIVVSRRSGFIVKGHGRLMAAQKLEWTKAPIDMQDYKTEADEYADMIADNKIAELANTDEGILKDLVLDMPDDFDLDLLGVPDLTLDKDFKDLDSIPDHSGLEVSDNKLNLYCGDCLAELKKIDENSIHSVVSDPPYALNFMGKKWDAEVPSVEVWKEVLRVLKPGGHVLSFSGTRTYHRMVVNIEDAGFVCRDMLQWIYGSGFPKSHDVSKAIDKMAGAEREVVGNYNRPDGSKPRLNTVSSNALFGGADSNDQKTSNPSTPQAKKWDGFGTALKPANEPIVLAMKPISEDTIAENVLKWGCGGINVDESRVEYKSTDDFENAKGGNSGSDKNTFGMLSGKGPKKQSEKITTKGRFPSNVILDETAAEMLDEQSGESKSTGGQSGVKGSNIYKHGSTDGENKKGCGFNDSGGASRFFYCAKSSKSERNDGLEGMPKIKGGSMTGKEYREDRPTNHPYRENYHPTVKPKKLMSYLIKLITPPNGIVLDPYMGSGSTGIAALENDFRFVGIEKEPEYFEIAKKRINNVHSSSDTD